MTNKVNSYDKKLLKVYSLAPLKRSIKNVNKNRIKRKEKGKIRRT